MRLSGPSVVGKAWDEPFGVAEQRTLADNRQLVPSILLGDCPEIPAFATRLIKLDQAP
jgi:hypothetical protein